MSATKVTVPDLGDFDEVEVIEVLVAEGDDVEAEQGLLTLETEKAAMDVPAPQAGRVVKLLVSVGDKVSAGTEIAEIEVAASDDASKDAGKRDQRKADDADDAPEASDDARDNKSRTETRRYKGSRHDKDREDDKDRGGDKDSTDGSDDRRDGHDGGAGGGPPRGRRLVVLGAGPAGYTAAFRAADLGLEVTLVERWPVLGGVCLNVGCIPSKALLHAARVIDEAAHLSAHGLDFGRPAPDLDRLRDWKQGVVDKLVGGLSALARQRRVRVVQGVGKFTSAYEIEVATDDGSEVVEFDQCIIAAGSEAVRLPDWPDDPRVVDSTGALELDGLPERMLVVGGGIIGLELGSVYAALGSRVSVAELTDDLMPGADRDLVRPLAKRLKQRFEAIMTGTRVTAAEAVDEGLKISFDGRHAPEGPEVYDRVLMAVGRRPNGGAIDAERAGVEVDERGFIRVDRQMRTNVEHIFAVGDIVGAPMLAHKGLHEGKVAAEVAAGHRVAFDARTIPSVAYTDPEVAWVGVTETEANAQDIAYEKGVFPWAASGRSLAMGRDEGLTKLLFDPHTRRVIGGGLVGQSAGDLVAEIGLAIEMGADATDLALTVHAHPTLSETVGLAAEAFEGTLTDLMPPKRGRG